MLVPRDGVGGRGAHKHQGLSTTAAPFEKQKHAGNQIPAASGETKSEAEAVNTERRDINGITEQPLTWGGGRWRRRGPRRIVVRQVAALLQRGS